MGRIITGDALKSLKTLSDGIADMCVTSPPYYGLRDYGMAGQIGLEETPEIYIKRLVNVFREVRRVLKDDGTLWVNIGDSYAGSGKGAAAHPENAKKYLQGTSRVLLGATETLKAKTPNCKPKDMIGIPWMLAFALRADGWYLRQDIIWHKPNPMPEPVTDRCVGAHEYIFLLSKRRQYHFDHESIKEPAIYPNDNRHQRTDCRRGTGYKCIRPRPFGKTGNNDRSDIGNIYVDTGLRNKRDVWSVVTKPYSDAHFAVFPPELIRPCIKAGSREGGVVLDPFFGSGTTGQVAIEEGRDYIGIELNPKYVKLAQKRISKSARQLLLAL